jgi:ribosomal protein S18 acetylase RimI-like enzyme
MPDRRPTLKALIHKTVARLDARGPREVVHLAAERVKGAWSSEQRLKILARPCREERSEQGPLVVRRATPDDAAAYARHIGTDSASTFTDRLSSTTGCYLVFEGYLIVHATWCTTSAAWTREIAAYLEPPPSDAYIYESFTRAEVRGRGVYPLAIRAISTDLHREGRDRMWVGVEADNAPSVRALTKGGFEERFDLVITRRFGRVSVRYGTEVDPRESLHIVAKPPGP